MKNLQWLMFIVALFGLSGCGVLSDFLADTGSSPTSSAAATVPPDMVIMTEPGEISTDRGTYCWSPADDQPGICADYAPPVYEPSQHQFIGGDSFGLRFDAPLPDRISAELSLGSNTMNRAARIPLEVVQTADDIYAVRIPEEASGDYVLLVFAVWDDTPNSPSGDASYSAPIRF